MNTAIFAIPAFKDNYIWAWLDQSSKNLWVVDPGAAQPVIDMLNKQHLNLAGILLTHHHYDHSGGVEELVHHSKNVPVFASHRSSVKGVTNYLKEKDEIVCSPFRLRVLEIPGHTLDHIAYFNDGILFCGDTLFSAGCGRVFEGTFPQMFHSLNKLAELPTDILIYCAHEYTQANLQFAKSVEPANPDIIAKLQKVDVLRAKQEPTLPSIMKEEKKVNPFLRCDVVNVVKAAETQVGHPLQNTLEVFKVLRNWKNNF